MKSKPLEVQLFHQLNELMKTLETFREDKDHVELFISTENIVEFSKVSADGFSAEQVAGGTLQEVATGISKEYDLQ